MKMTYRKFSEYIPVDLERLRPKGSYKNLQEKRTHTIDRLIVEYGGIPTELLRDRVCPTCGSADYRLVMTKDHLQIVECEDCELIFVSPIFDEQHYRATYQSKEYADIVEKLGFDSHEYRVERFGTERIDIIADYLTTKAGPIRHLDIGCSTGFVVEAAKKRGWDSIGLDLNRSAVEFGKARGLKLEHGELFDIDYKPATFDVVTAFDVLEHVVEPRTVIRRVWELLAPSGLLFLFVPNWDSASRILMGRDAHFIWPTHHLNYYTPASIHDAVERTGFDVEMVTTEGLDIFDYIWKREEVDGENMMPLTEIANELQFFANAGGWGKNLRCLARKRD